MMQESNILFNVLFSPPQTLLRVVNSHISNNTCGKVKEVACGWEEGEVYKVAIISRG